MKPVKLEEVKPAQVEQVQPAPVEPEKPAPQQASPEAAAPVRTRRAVRPASSLSMSALLQDDEPELVPVMEEKKVEKPLPDGQFIKDKWAELAAEYADKPRLANALSNASLEVSDEEGRKLVCFTVTNEAQKKWIEERMLRELEDRFSKILADKRIRLEPVVIAEEPAEPIKYLATEKAEDLIARNEEVKNIVIDLGLDVK